MGFPIPRIQYKNLDTTGNTTSGSGTILVTDTDTLELGMFVRGTGIPTGAVIGTISAGVSITLASSVHATATNIGTDLNFGWEVAFDYPPVEPDGEALNTNASTSDSLSGIRQTSVNYIEGVRKLNLRFLSPTLYTSMLTFLAYALTGEGFRYYDDKTTSVYTDVELNALKVAPKKIAPRSATTYSWEIPIELRRVL